MKLSEKIIISALIIALLLAVVGLILESKVVTFIAMGLLACIAVAYTIIQISEYFKVMDEPPEGKKQLVLLIVTVVVCLIILCLAILTFTGKLSTSIA